MRAIASVLDLSWVYGELSPHYPALGRPSIDPILMIRMLILGYAFGLRSERLLCREVRVNLAYRWFCGLSIEDKIPDHSVFSRARNERFRDNDIFRRVFERVVEACISAGLVGGKEFAVDASLIAADANKQRSIPGSEWIKERDPETASRAVKEYMATLDDAAFGAATKVTPKFVSPSDPAAQWTGAMRGPAFFAYADNYLIDVKVGIIMDVEASRAIRQAEVGAVEDDDRADTRNASISNLSGSRAIPPTRFSPHTDTVAGTLPWAHLSQRYSSPLKIADRIYLGRAAPGSPYGAGALIVLMFWMYCSAQIFLFGAELTKAIADEREPRSAGATRNNSRGREFLL